MKKMMFTFILCILATLNANAQDVTKLPEPDKKLGVPLTEALAKRRSDREFDANKDITDNQLSLLLWAACGVNRADKGLLTIPTAINAKDISVYVCRKDGVALYDPYANTLTKVSAEDIRPQLAGRQQNMSSAPLFLLIVSDKSKFRGNAEHYSAMDAGYSSQNICLMCAALGLKTVPRAMMDVQAVTKALNFGENIIVELNHPIGY